MSDDKRTFILETGQTAELNDRGIVKVISHELPAHHFCMNVAHRRDYTKSVTQIRSPNYESLLEFLKQLESLDYLLLNIERADGAMPKLVL